MQNKMGYGKLGTKQKTPEEKGHIAGVSNMRSQQKQLSQGSNFRNLNRKLKNNFEQKWWMIFVHSTPHNPHETKMQIINVDGGWLL